MSVTGESIKDARWRLEMASAALGNGHLTTGLDYIVEAGEVVQAILEREKRERMEARA